MLTTSRLLQLGLQHRGGEGLAAPACLGCEARQLLQPDARGLASGFGVCLWEFCAEDRIFGMSQLSKAEQATDLPRLRAYRESPSVQPLKTSMFLQHPLDKAGLKLHSLHPPRARVSTAPLPGFCTGRSGYHDLGDEVLLSVGQSGHQRRAMASGLRRPRSRSKNPNSYVFIYIYIYIYVCVYMYMYI